jgi:hypothetical protein
MKVLTSHYHQGYIQKNMEDSLLPRVLAAHILAASDESVSVPGKTI